MQNFSVEKICKLAKFSRTVSFKIVVLKAVLLTPSHKKILFLRFEIFLHNTCRHVSTSVWPAYGIVPNLKIFSNPGLYVPFVDVASHSGKLQCNFNCNFTLISSLHLYRTFRILLTCRFATAAARVDKRCPYIFQLIILINVVLSTGQSNEGHGEMCQSNGT